MLIKLCLPLHIISKVKHATGGKLVKNIRAGDSSGQSVAENPDRVNRSKHCLWSETACVASDLNKSITHRVKESL